jgi:hypothetical protein
MKDNANMKQMMQLCNNVMTHTSLQVIKVGTIIIPTYAILWFVLKSIDFLSRNTRNIHTPS